MGNLNSLMASVHPAPVMETLTSVTALLVSAWVVAQGQLASTVNVAGTSRTGMHRCATAKVGKKLQVEVSWSSG